MPPNRGNDWDRNNDGRPDRGQGGWDRNNDGRPDRGQGGWDRNNDGRPDRGQGGWDRNNDGRPDRGNGGWDRNNDGRPDGRWDGRRPGEGRQTRNRDRNRHWYDSRNWRHEYRSSRRFRLGVYAYPRGWYSNSWRYGDILPYGWYGSNYYLNDYWSYGLPMPPIGCEWVRVGDDAYLVDIWSGRVYSVYYNLFW